VNINALLTLAPLKGKQLNDLTLVELQGVLDAFNIAVPVTDELKLAGLALLQDKPIDTVADLIQDPQSVMQLVTFFKGGIKEVQKLGNVEKRPVRGASFFKPVFFA